MDELMPQLYDSLISICSKCDSFYYKDVELDLIKYRIFNYNLCSYEQFHSFPFALNCRGTMFNINDLENIKLVCLPPLKFFNYEEGNGNKIHQLGTFGVQMEKLDGSLISTYLHNNQLKLKSKTSLISEQALQAINLLTGSYRDEIEEIVRRGYTVNFEYTSPFNQIVLYYSESKLRVLSIRSHLNGETIFGLELILFLKQNHFLTILENVVSFKTILNSLNHQQLIEDIRKETSGEGYVIQIIDQNNKSYLVKIKTEKYLLLHHTKFNRYSPRYLFECVIYEQTDDLKSLFTNEKEVLDKINEMEQQIRPIYNKIIQTIERFYQENKDLSRKDYAIKILNTNHLKIYMPLLMNLYLKKENDYKKFSLNHIKDIFNIDDQNDKSNTTNQDQD